MPRYRVSIIVPVFIDKAFVLPILIWRWFWHGHAYRLVKVLPDKYAKVEPVDYHEISQYTWWAKESCGKYSAVRLVPGGNCGKVVYMHRQIMDAPEGKLVDHKNRDSMDNRRCNLRFATKGQNNMNQGGRRGASSEYKGVSWYKPKKCWRGMIKVNGKNKSLGYFESEVKAAKAYDEAARKYHGEFAYQNFSEEQVLTLRSRIRKLIRSLLLAVRDFRVMDTQSKI